ncbi:MAG: DNA polymerase III subunit gamma/tau [Oscillospiraceae bacterium]|nr:DNA polymerase III subunit gamma/tau [Oscillospiraceae bacterium]
MYQVLYRKWRPRVFSDVVGQPHITSTLKNEIGTGRHSHAYLFTGSRGTGKTTCAKILAKAVNCLHPVNGDPCNECEICRGIDSGAVMDVIEIDAASNNGVDNIRDIRQEANFTPAKCKYRVYIIDEVHMLSAGAFNALLKTLEEPPEHVKFILATTEVHKLPATILSRCQRFDFRRIPSEDMIARMNYISDKEGITLDRDAAMLISRISDGGMRDALSLLDQCMGRDMHVTAQLVSSVAGLTSKDYLFRLAHALCRNDCAGAMEILDELHSSSCDMERLCSELINHYRSLMVVKTVRRAEEILVCTKEEYEQTKAQSEEYSLENILRCVDLLQEALTNMKRGVNKRIEMEMAVIKLSSPELKQNTASLAERVAALEDIVRNASLPQAHTVTHTEKEEKPKEEAKLPAEKAEAEKTEAEKTNDEARCAEQKVEAPAADADESFRQWPEVVQEIKKTNLPLWGVLDNSEAYIHGDFVLVDCRYPTFGSLIRQGSNAADVKRAVYAVTGEKKRLGIYKRADSGQTAAKENDPLDNLIEKMRSSEIKVTFNDE